MEETPKINEILADILVTDGEAISDDMPDDLAAIIVANNIILALKERGYIIVKAP
jgi:hypothetical protein